MISEQSSVAGGIIDVPAPLELLEDEKHSYIKAGSAACFGRGAETSLQGFNVRSDKLYAAARTRPLGLVHALQHGL